MGISAGRYGASNEHLEIWKDNHILGVVTDIGAGKYEWEVAEQSGIVDNQVQAVSNILSYDLDGVPLYGEEEV